MYVYLFIYFYLLLISVLVRRGSNGKAELVLLDHGLYEYLPSSVRQPLCRLWKAIVTNSHADMKTYASELGVKGIALKLIDPHVKVNMMFIHVLCCWETDFSSFTDSILTLTYSSVHVYVKCVYL